MSIHREEHEEEDSPTRSSWSLPREQWASPFRPGQQWRTDENYDPAKDPELEPFRVPVTAELMRTPSQ